MQADLLVNFLLASVLCGQILGRNLAKLIVIRNKAVHGSIILPWLNNKIISGAVTVSADYKAKIEHTNINFTRIYP